MNSADSQRESFSLVGLLHDDVALDRPHDVELQENVAYVPGKGGSLAIIDVSNVTKPKLLSSLVGLEGLEDAETVLPMGDVLLLGTRDFLAVDVSDPANPVSIAQYRGGSLFPTRGLILSGTPRYDNAHDLVYRDGYLYVTAQNDNQFGILKINDRRTLELAEQSD